MSRALALALCLLGLGTAGAARAEVNITYHAELGGWGDTTQAEPVGGNRGTTLGEQRRIALRYALSLWQTRLDSPIPIALEISFDKLGCESNAVVLGQASNLAWYQLDAPGADPALLYPSALANSLAGRDLAEDRADIRFALNLSVDEECRELTGGFYYGLDGKAATGSDFVHVVLHEIAHGLGIASTLDFASGASALEDAQVQVIDVYSAKLRDLDLDRSWAELSSAQRRSSMQNVRRVVWDGPRTAQLAGQTLEVGEPQLAFQPSLPGFSGFVADSNLGSLPLDEPVTAAVFDVNGCDLPVAPMAIEPGQVLLFPYRCLRDLPHLAELMHDAGAAGALLTGSALTEAPPLPVDSGTTGPHLLEQPVYVLSQSDARAARQQLAQGPLIARMRAAADRRTGSDEQHRPLVYISRPSAPGSSVSHLEELVRPDELMEPVTGATPVHDVSLTVAMLADMGWSAHCGDGELSEGERCDEGPRNSDRVANRCRSDCRPARCGDAVVDHGEQCDDGAANSDSAPDACRTSCLRAACGDGVVDEGEACDTGQANSDSAPGACRNDCRPARCGDAVVDSGEQCDDGAANSDSAPDACRASCVRPTCGDGVIDADEECDDGPANSAVTPDACRKRCVRAHCGDGVVDSAEACDDGANGHGDGNGGAETCRDDCAAARCGEHDTEPCQKQPAESMTQADGAGSGCGCRVSSMSHGSPRTFLQLATWLSCGLWLRRRRRGVRMHSKRAARPPTRRSRV